MVCVCAQEGCDVMWVRGVEGSGRGVFRSCCSLGNMKNEKCASRTPTFVRRCFFLFSCSSSAVRYQVEVILPKTMRFALGTLCHLDDVRFESRSAGAPHVGTKLQACWFLIYFQGMAWLSHRRGRLLSQKVISVLPVQALPLKTPCLGGETPE